MAILTFLPGTMCDRRVWMPVWDQLGDEADIHYVPIEQDRTRAAIQARIAGTGNAHGPLVLVGFSMGGYFALEYALENPERVASLVLVSSSAFGLTAAEKAERTRTIDFLARHEYHGIASARLNQFVHPTRRTDPAVAGVMRAMDHDLGKEVLIAQLKQTTERVSLGPRLGDLRMPVLLCGADGDVFASWTAIERMRDLIPDVRAVMAVETGHMIPLERPEWLALQIADFLGL